MAAEAFRVGMPSELLSRLRDALQETKVTADNGLSIVLQSAVTRLAANESSVLMPNGDDSLAFYASTNPELKGPGAPAVPIGRSIAGFVYLTGQTTAMDKAADSPKHFSKVDSFLRDKSEEEAENKGFAKTKEYIAAPIARGDTVLGVLTFVNRSDPERARFNKEEIFLATRYAELCALVLDHIGKVDNQSAATERALEAGFGDKKPEDWPVSPVMADGAGGDPSALRAHIGLALDELSEEDLELVQNLVDRLSGEPLVA